jgi:hypothetical protein
MEMPTASPKERQKERSEEFGISSGANLPKLEGKALGISKQKTNLEALRGIFVIGIFVGMYFLQICNEKVKNKRESSYGCHQQRTRANLLYAARISAVVAFRATPRIL